MNQLEFIQDLVNRANNLPHRDSRELDSVLRRAEMVIRNVFGETSKYVKDLEHISFYPTMAPADDEWHNESWKSGQGELVNLCNTMLEELKLFGAFHADDNSKRTASTSDRIF